MESKIEFYSVRKKPHERNEIIAVVSKNNGGYVCYSLSTGMHPAMNTDELLKELISSKRVQIRRINSIENYLKMEFQVHAVNLSKLENLITYQRLCHMLEEFVKNEEQPSVTEKGR